MSSGTSRIPVARFGAGVAGIAVLGIDVVAGVTGTWREPEGVGPSAWMEMDAAFATSGMGGGSTESLSEGQGHTSSQHCYFSLIRTMVHVQRQTT